MKKETLGLASIALLVVGCASGPQKPTSSEIQALKGGPMPPGTWDRIAAARKRFEASHGTPSTTPAPSGG